jgi:hypothetical protein
MQEAQQVSHITLDPHDICKVITSHFWYIHIIPPFLSFGQNLQNLSLFCVQRNLQSNEV